MTNVDQNLPPRRELPVSTVQLAAITSDAVICGLGESPYLLGLIVLTASASARRSTFFRS